MIRNRKDGDHLLRQLMQQCSIYTHTRKIAMMSVSSQWQIKGDYKPDQKTVKARLVEKYEDDILFTFQKNKKTVVCFKNIGEKILNDAFYQQKCKSEKEERLR
ncbi:hypothetical protein JTB14_015995 [Gonioctena quinquepunctata]|nr:hypothetical protein JTB14_015995 [Gonioctena quinquepunctata]